MKALRMTFISEVTRATKNPVKDMAKLRGGIGDKKLDHHQIARLLADKKAEQRVRAMKNEQRYLASKLKASV
jgi:hypothetical protein